MKSLQTGQHPQHQPARVPQRLIAREARGDAIDHRAERTLPSVRIYAVSRGHRGVLVVPHKQRMLARWPPTITQKRRTQTPSAPKITIYGCSTRTWRSASDLG